MTDFITKMESVDCAVWTGSLNRREYVPSLKGSTANLMPLVRDDTERPFIVNTLMNHDRLIV